MSTTDKKLKHLEWTINSRNANQMCSLKLLRLFEEYESFWKTSKLARAAQDLTAVTFSLWRAAFLAEKTGTRAKVFEHGKQFLEKVIEDNSISYPQDKVSREWTFNYYTRNARSSLVNLNNYWPDAAPPYKGAIRSAAQRWEYCQELLDEAVSGFEGLLKKKKLLVDKSASAAQVRVERKKRRAAVRKIALEKRSESG